VTEGLMTCGEYANTADLEKMIEHKKKGQRVRTEQHKAHTGADHLGMIYWQLTGGNIAQNTQQALDSMRDVLCKDILKENFHNPFAGAINIVGFDFVDLEHCGLICALNDFTV
jgi:hypothetical protein